MNSTDGRAPGGNLELGEREDGKAHDNTRPKLTTAEQAPSRAALGQAAARAAVASLALAEARKIGNLAERRERLLLARVQLRKSLLHLEADLERVPA